MYSGGGEGMPQSGRGSIILHCIVVECSVLPYHIAVYCVLYCVCVLYCSVVSILLQCSSIIESILYGNLVSVLCCIR